MRRMKRIHSILLVSCFFIVISSTRTSGQSTNCYADVALSVRVRSGLFSRKTYKCSSISVNNKLCSSTNLKTKQKVGLTCAKQCPLVSNCDKSITSVPPGPYILPDKSSKVAKIPRVSGVNVTELKVNCPHLATGLRRWHSASTWGGSIPISGQDVTIPAGVRVVIDQNVTEKLGIVTIPVNSELIIGSNVNGIELSVSGINVLGNLTVGSESCPMTNPVTITLYGVRPANAVTQPPATVYKGILVSGGRLSLHGKRFFQTWTRLAQTVDPGSNVLILQETTNWVVGQEIVIVTSTMKDSRDFNQNEVRKIINVVPKPSGYGVGSIIYLDAPLNYRHIANQYYQVEVGLLSRLIKIQGSQDDSEPTDPDDGSCKDPAASKSWTIYFNTSMPCMTKQRTGFGGHVRIENGGSGQVEGVELYRMGQTNVMGRYPMHFHLLGNCPSCYFKHSSVHRSYYRCISIHGTHNSTTTENVAFDVIGYCYYLEDGVEQDNTISYNLAAHIHTIGPDMPRGDAQQTNIYVQNEYLTLPADVTASGFYITNIHNKITGNAASGGWSGFAFPVLNTALQTFKTNGYVPLRATDVAINGNTAHSTGWWWYHAGAFYLGGNLYYNSNGILEYNPGRGPLSRDPCYLGGTNYCPNSQQDWIQINNTKAFLVAGVGINSWSGRIEVHNFESHDSRLALEALSSGFWLNNALAVCRTGESLGFKNAQKLDGNGFVWYDTGQSHILTNVTFRNCGYRSVNFTQYNTSPTRGCGDDPQMGCSPSSSTFGFLTHSDQFTPEIMQATKSITFDNCGRRFKFSNEQKDTVSGRGQNWIDADGSVSGLGVPTLIGSGLNSAKDWWGVDDDVFVDREAPLRFIKQNLGPKRKIGHMSIRWDNSLHDQVGNTLCGNGNNVSCPWEGFVRHMGKKFSPFLNSSRNNGLPVTARGDLVGPTGGYGWILNFNKSAPRWINFTEIVIDPNSPLLVSIPYPIGTTFEIVAFASGCWFGDGYVCNYTFTPTTSIDAVRNGTGSTYFVDTNGVITFRIAQTANGYVGNSSSFLLPSYSTPPRRYSESNLWSLQRFERAGVLLPQQHWSAYYRLKARCPSDNAASSQFGYCSESVQANYDPDVCPDGYVQVAYDKCCQGTNCVFS